MFRDMQRTENPAGEQITVLDLDTHQVVFNNQHGVEIGTASDPENIRQLIENG